MPLLCDADVLELLLVFVLLLLVVAACLVLVFEELFTVPLVVELLLFCLLVVLEFTVPLPVLFWLVVVLFLFTVFLFVSLPLFTVPLFVSLLRLTVPLLFLVDCDWRSVDWFELLPLLVELFLLLSVASCLVLFERFTVPLLREFSGVVLFVFLSTFVSLLVVVEVLPESLVPLFTLDLFGALAGLSVLPEFLVTSGRYTFTERSLTLVLPALPELVTFLTETLLPVERSMSLALGPL